MSGLGLETLTEYNLTINTQVKSFLLFCNSKLKDFDTYSFNTGFSFDINFLVKEGDFLNVFALTDFYTVRRYALRSDGFIAGLDTDGKEFVSDQENIALFLNGKLISRDCYTVNSSSVRLHVRNERIDALSEKMKEYVDWEEGDSVLILIENKDDSVKKKKISNRVYFSSCYLKSTTERKTSVRAANDVNFTSVRIPSLIKGKIVVFVNDEIIPYKELTFPGGQKTSEEIETSNALIINRNLSTTDKVVILSFYNSFDYYEYVARSGQTNFEGSDLQGKFLSYSPEEGAATAHLFEYYYDYLGNLVQQGVPWSRIPGVKKGSIIRASCSINGVSYSGKAVVSNNNIESTSISVNIERDFGREEFDSSEWYIDPARSKSIVSYLDDRTNQTFAIPDILGTFQYFFLEHFQDALDRLCNIRNSNKIEPSLLNNTLDMLGMRLDLTTMSDENKKKAIQEVVNFYKRCGTKASVNFLGYINDKVISLNDALWTRDYVNFYSPEELGAEYKKKELLDFTDYRYISAVPTSFDDYGVLLDKKVPFSLSAKNQTLILKEYGHAFFPKHWGGVGYSMRWVDVYNKLEITSEEYLAGDYFLVIIDDSGVQNLALCSKIETDPDETILLPEFYYLSKYNSLVFRDKPEASVSAPLAIVNIDKDSFNFSIKKIFDKVTYIGNYVFATEGIYLDFNYLIEKNIKEKRLSIFDTKMLDVELSNVKNVLLVTNENLNVDEVSSFNLSYQNFYLYKSDGGKPDVVYHSLLVNNGKYFIYNCYNEFSDFYYDKEGNKKTDSNGMTSTQYMSQNSWNKCSSPIEAEQLPVFTKDDEIEKLNAYTLYKIKNVYYVFVKKKSYEYKEIETEYGTKKEYFLTYLKYSKWYKITRLFTNYEDEGEESSFNAGILINDNFYDMHHLKNSSKFLLPYIEGEIYYDLNSLKHFVFKNGAWEEIFVLSIGEFEKGKIEDSEEKINLKIPVLEKGRKFEFEFSEEVDLDSIKIKVNSQECVIRRDFFVGISLKEVLFLKKDFNKYYLEFFEELKEDDLIEFEVNKIKTEIKELTVYEKKYNNIKKLTFFATKEKDFRFDSFTNVRSIDLNSVSIYVNGEKFKIVRENIKELQKDEKGVLLRNPSKDSLYILFGNSDFGTSLSKNSKIDFYYIEKKDKTISNRWFLKEKTFDLNYSSKVAYDYGKITKRAEANWVFVREFDPPEGFYPTNHVLFNVSANGVKDSIETEIKTKKQFYEIASVPWVLDRSRNIVDFGNMYLGLPSAFLSSSSLFFEEIPLYIPVSFSSFEKNVTYEIKNTSDKDYIIVVDKNNKSKTVEHILNIRSVYLDEAQGFEVLSVLYENNTENNFPLETKSLSSFKYIAPLNTVYLNEGDRLFSKEGLEFILKSSRNGYRTTSEKIVSKQELGQREISLLKKKVVFKIDVNSQNLLKKDVINIYFSGVKSNKGEIEFFLGEDEEVEFSIKVEQNGCNRFEETFKLKFSDFVNGDKFSYMVNLTLADVLLTLYGPSENSFVIANGEKKKSGETFVFKYGTKVDYFAEEEGYKTASSVNKKSKILYENFSDICSLEKEKYSLFVSCTVNGKESNEQPIYLNNILNTTDSRFALGENVHITAGGLKGKTSISTLDVVVSSDPQKNKYVLNVVDLGYD